MPACNIEVKVKHCAVHEPQLGLNWCIPDYPEPRPNSAMLVWLLCTTSLYRQYCVQNGTMRLTCFLIDQQSFGTPDSPWLSSQALTMMPKVMNSTFSRNWSRLELRWAYRQQCFHEGQKLASCILRGLLPLVQAPVSQHTQSLPCARPC